MSAKGKGLAAIVAGVLFIMMAIFIAPPAHPQCGTRIFCYFMGLTTFGQIASLAAIPLIVLGFSILDQARK